MDYSNLEEGNTEAHLKLLWFFAKTVAKGAANVYPGLYLERFRLKLNLIIF